MKFLGRLLLGVLTLSVAIIASTAAEEKKAVSFEEIYSEPSKAVERPAKVPSIRLAGKEISNQTASGRAPEASVRRLVKFKDLLVGVSPEDRIEFADRLRLVDGKVASARLAPLRKTMSESQVNQLIDRLTESPEDASVAEPAKSDKKSGLIQLSNLLEGLSSEAKAEFYDSMVFKNGELVSFFVGGLRQGLSKPAFSAAMKVLAGSDDSTIVSGTKGLCGTTWCNNSECDMPPIGERLRCISIEIDGICKTATCK